MPTTILVERLYRTFFDLAAGGETIFSQRQKGELLQQLPGAVLLQKQAQQAGDRCAVPLVARGVAYLPQMLEGLLLHRVLRQRCLGIVDGLAGVAVGGSFLQHGRDGLDVERTGSVDYLVELQKGLRLLLKSLNDFFVFSAGSHVVDVRETRRAT